MNKIKKIKDFAEACEIYKTLKEKYPSCFGQFMDDNPTGWVIIPKSEVKNDDFDLTYTNYFAFSKGSEAKKAYEEFFDKEKFLCLLGCAQAFHINGLAACGCTAERVCRDNPKRLEELRHRYA